MILRSSLFGVLTLLSLSSTAAGGVYSTIEPNWPLDKSYFRHYQEVSLIPLRTWVANKGLNDLTTIAWKLGKNGVPQGAIDPLSSEERLDLAASLIRCRQPQEAIRILAPLQVRERDNFLVSSTLGTAYMMTGEYQRAIDMMDDGLEYWRTRFADLPAARRQNLQEVWKWNEHQFGWFGRCEKVQRRLAFLRMREFKSGTMDMSRALSRLDPLFPENAKAGEPTIRYVAESGKFEPGKIAVDEAAKLPKDAILVLEQLLIWFPDDLRLYLQLGELVNAQGDVASARIIYNEALSKFSQQPQFSRPKVEGDPPDAPDIILPDPATMLPLFIQRFPEVGQKLKLLRETPDPRPAEPPQAEPRDKAVAPPDDGEKSLANLDWQTLGVGIGAGVLLGFLASWQIRDLLQRRQRRPSQAMGR